jgi:hypothetical protein
MARDVEQFFLCSLAHSVGCLVLLVTVSFAVQKLFNLRQSHLSILALISWASGVLFGKLLPVPYLQVFSCSNFKVSSVMIRSFIILLAYIHCTGGIHSDNSE